LAGLLAASAGGTDIMSILGSLLGGGVGGGALITIAGLIKGLIAKK